MAEFRVGSTYRCHSYNKKIDFKVMSRNQNEIVFENQTTNEAIKCKVLTIGKDEICMMNSKQVLKAKAFVN